MTHEMRRKKKRESRAESGKAGRIPTIEIFRVIRQFLSFTFKLQTKRDHKQKRLLNATVWLDDVRDYESCFEDFKKQPKEPGKHL
jgi:hypothetical protein